MTDIQHIKKVGIEPDQEVIRALEEALALAKKGNLRSVIVAGNMTAHQTYSNYVTDDLVDTIGMVAYLQHRLCFKLESKPDVPPND